MYVEEDFHLIDNTWLGFYAGAFPWIYLVLCVIISLDQLCMFLLDVTHEFDYASIECFVEVEQVLCFRTLHILVCSTGEISTWYRS